MHDSSDDFIRDLFDRLVRDAETEYSFSMITLGRPARTLAEDTPVGIGIRVGINTVFDFLDRHVVTALYDPELELPPMPSDVAGTLTRRATQTFDSLARRHNRNPAVDRPLAPFAIAARIGVLVALKFAVQTFPTHLGNVLVPALHVGRS